MSTQGILTAADERMEWLLPWWWERVREHNQLPIAVVDFGMSHFGKAFCEERGILLPFSLDDPLDTSTPHAEKWAPICGEIFFENRKRWMLKPFAFQLTPFERTLWLDLDCEVLASLDLLFTLEGDFWLAQENEPSLRRAREEKLIAEDEMLYNSGVIVYSQGSSIIKQWGEMVIEEGEDFWSDQHVLSRMIHRDEIPVGVLSSNYNWRMTGGLNLHAVIIHWVGSWGKEYIRLHGGIGSQLSALPKI